MLFGNFTIATSVQHRIHGAFDVFQLFDGCVRKNESPVAVAMNPTTAAPIIANNEQESTPNDFGNTNNNEIPTMTTGGDYEDDNEDDDMIESEDEDEETDESNSSDEFPTSNADVNSINAQQSISFSGSSDADASTIRGLWIAHGILLSIAWGILAPLAIGAAFLRNNFNVLKTNGRWLQIHFYLSGLVALFTLLGFILAVVATKKKTVMHYSLIKMFIIKQVLLYSFWCSFKLFLVTLDRVLSLLHRLLRPITSSQIANHHPIVTFQTKPILHSSKMMLKNYLINKNNKHTITSKKSYLRLFWECGHRLLGITLLLLAVYNCQTGIILQSENYAQDDKETLTNIFWSITGSITVIIFFLRFVVRI
jgi:hypothetical protein